MPRKSQQQSSQKQEEQLERQRQEEAARKARREKVRAEKSESKESEAERRKRLEREVGEIDYDLLARAFVAGQRSIERGLTSGEQIKALLGCVAAYNESVAFEEEVPGRVARAYVRAIEEMWSLGLPGEGQRGDSE